MGITTSTEYGRQGILWPDFAHEGGSALHGKITSSIAAISNDITTKWTGEQTLADGASFSFEHNFGMALGELSVAIYVAGAFVQEGSSAQWTLAQVDTNNITITNNTGSSATFFAYVMGFNIEKIIGDASATNKGLITSVNQTLAGLKTFLNGIATANIYEDSVAGVGQGVNIDGLNVKDGNLSNLEVSQLEQQSATPATPASGKSKFYVKDDGVAYILNSDGVETPVGSGSTIERVSHTAHGFIVGTPLYDAGTNFAKGNCSDSAKAEVIAMVSRVIDANTFEVITDGIPSGGLVAACFKGGVLPADGDVCFLSDEDGKLTTVDPNEGPVGNVSKPLFFVRSVDATYAYGYFKNMRGTTVGGTNLYTTIPLNNGTATTILNLADDTTFPVGSSGELVGGGIKILQSGANPDYSFAFRLMWTKQSSTVVDIQPDALAATPPGFAFGTSGAAITVSFTALGAFESGECRYTMNAAPLGAKLPLQIDSALITQNVVGNGLNPTGAVIPFAGAAAPTGYLLCDGSAVSRTTYAALFAVLSTTFGSGDGSTTFNLPDMRETIPVGVGTRGAGVAVHDTYTLGQFKDDQFEGHNHQVSLAGNTTPGGQQTIASTNGGVQGTVAAAMVSTSGRSGTTTHGKQMGLNYIIKT